VTKVGQEKKTRHESRKEGKSTIKDTITDIITHWKSHKVSQDIKTKTTHYVDKDVVDVDTIEYWEDETWDEIETTTETDIWTED
jgi:hypothetical protein